MHLNTSSQSVLRDDGSLWEEPMHRGRLGADADHGMNAKFNQAGEPDVLFVPI